MIRSLELKGWRSHYSSSFEFSKGTNVFIGQMGSGKSSIADAISYALFGTFPSLNTKKITLDETIMRKPNQKDLSEIKLRFDAGEKEYAVERLIKRGKGTNEAKLYCEGRLVAGPKQKDVNEKIEDILGINFDLFSRAIYCEQNDIDYFLKLTPSDRKKRLDDLFELTSYEDMRSSLNQVKNRLKKAIDENRKSYSAFKEQTDKDKIDEEKRLLAEKEKDAERLKDEIKESRKAFEEMKKKLSEETKKRDKAKVLEKEIASTEGLLKRLESEIKGKELKESKKDLENENEELKEQMTALEKKIDGLVGKIEAKRKEKELKEKKIRENGKAIERIEKSVEELKSFKEEQLSKDLEQERQTAEKAREEKAKCAKGIELAEKALLALKEADSKCPTCSQEMTEEKRRMLIENKSDERKTAEKRVKELESDIKKKEANAKTIESQIKRCEMLKQEAKEFERLKNESEALQKDVNEIFLDLEIKELEKDKKEREALKERADELKDKLKIVEAIALYENSKQNHNALKAEIEKLCFNEKEFEENNRVFAKEEDRERMLNTQLKALKEFVNDKKRQIKELEASLERIETLKKRVETGEKNYEMLSVFGNALTKTQGELRTLLIQAVNDAMNEIWQKIYPYKDFTSARIDANDDDYLIKVRELNKEWVNVEGVLSGGERSSAALTIRIAISLVLAKKLSWLILDEPTHNLDSNAVNLLSDVLKNELPELVEQIFIITHDKELEKAASGSLYVLKRDKNENGTTIPEIN